MKCNSQSCNHIYCHIGENYSAIKIFLREFLHAPTNVGAVCSSSKALASTMVNLIPLVEEGIIIDLGAGSGVVSEQLLHIGVPPRRILAIEISPGFTNSFKKRCPNVSLLTGDARKLGSLLEKHSFEGRICGIISSLPFRVMPSDVVQEILQEIGKIAIRHEALLVQYSYAWWMRYPLCEYGFAPQSAKIVLNNLPPARVEVYKV